MNDKKCIKFLKVGFTLISILGLIAFVVILSISIVKNDWTLMYGFLLCFFASYLSMFLAWFIPNKIIDFGLNKNKKYKAMILFGSCYILKYSLIVLPILIGQLINMFAFNMEPIFNAWTMLAATLIYPLSIMLLKFWFIRSSKTKNDDIKTEVNKALLLESSPC